VNLPAPLRERLSREDASDSNNWLTNELLRITAMLLEPRFLYVLFVAAVSTGKVSILSATTILREDSGTQKQQFIQTLVVYAHECDVIFASWYLIVVRLIYFYTFAYHALRCTYLCSEQKLNKIVNYTVLKCRNYFKLVTWTRLLSSANTEMSAPVLRLTSGLRSLKPRGHTYNIFKSAF